MSHDYLKIGKELSDEVLEALIEQAISGGYLKQCFRCEVWDINTEIYTRCIGDEYHSLCQHCE